MSRKQQDSSVYQVGDKVRIRSGLYSGARGIIRTGSDGHLEVEIDEGKVAHVDSEEITNYSLAARRAWKAMPKRAGRPRLSTPRKKMVSMRLDIDLWERLDDAAKLGLITNRQDAVNNWVRERLNTLFDTESHKGKAHPQS